ncbi:MAG: flavin reductase family protein [Actinobacteria bacterium]|nr:flavin reductase family protein [Actinomycetota bacterium]MBL7123992.1 flavin reductase family protein [Actinomycetota bacterium]
MKITTLTNPRQTILLTCRAEGKDNVMTLDWHTPLSFEPVMYAVSIGKTRYSLSLIRKSKVFVVNFMSKDFEKELLFCGRHSGKTLDKFKETGLEKEEAETINCPRIKQALGYLECKVEKETEVGDHFLFIARVTKSELKQKGKRLFHLFADKFTTTMD